MGVSRVLSYLESLNTQNAFTKKLNDKEVRGWIEVACPA